MTKQIAFSFLLFILPFASGAREGMWIPTLLEQNIAQLQEQVSMLVQTQQMILQALGAQNPASGSVEPQVEPVSVEPVEVEVITLDPNGLTGHIDHIVAARSASFVYFRLKADGVPVTDGGQIQRVQAADAVLLSFL